MIKRTEVLDLIKQVQEKNGFRTFSAYSTLYNTIKDMPDAREMAKWIKEGDLIYCSNCAGRINEYQYEFGASKYCPCCGAYMRKH